MRAYGHGKTVCLITEKTDKQYERSLSHVSKRKNLIEYLHGFCSRADDIIATGGTGRYPTEAKQEEMLKILKYIYDNVINYCSPAENTFHYDNPLVDACYLYKYGLAYAFEYSFVFEKIIRDYYADGNNNILGTCDFGCGSMIVAWAIAYAMEKVLETTPLEGVDGSNLRYTGYDTVDWWLRFGKTGNDDSDEDDYLRQYYCGGNPHIICGEGTGDIVSAFKCTGKNDFPSYYNVWVFSKILNELDEYTTDKMCESIRERVESGSLINNRTHYIYVSHSKYKLKEGMKVLDRILDIIDASGKFTIDDDFIDRICWNDAICNHEASKILKKYENDLKYKYYQMNYCETDDQSPMYIYEYNNDFRRYQKNDWPLQDVDLFFNKTNEWFEDYRRQYYDNIIYPMVKLKYSRFQVIKITERD